MRSNVLFSAGGGSWRAAKVSRKAHQDREMRLIFTDVLYEDADAYRFLVQGAANVFGRRADWAPAAEDFPDYRVAEEVPFEEYCGNPAFRAFLAQLRDRAAEEIPELTWLVEGRDPWEIFRDERFLGNSSVDPCSRKLKREILDRWKVSNCDPATDRFIYGIGEHEKHRFDDGDGGGIGPRLAAKGWICEAPLIGLPELNPILFMRAEGLAPPRLYALGYMHNNCGGFCCKAGHAHYQLRLRVQPERFAYDAMMEGKMRAFLGREDIAMLTDRRGGDKKPITLDALAARLGAEPQLRFEYEAGSSGCGCMLDEVA